MECRSYANLCGYCFSPHAHSKFQNWLKPVRLCLQSVLGHLCTSSIAALAGASAAACFACALLPVCMNADTGCRWTMRQSLLALECIRCAGGEMHAVTFGLAAAEVCLAPIMCLRACCARIALPYLPAL
eukprot:1601880-Pleurochrysis_carterae.AAC.3